LARIPAEFLRRRYVSQLITEEQGHKLLFTPPYHPELVPIEVIWGVIKNGIAADPARTMDELGQKIIESCGAVTEKAWLGAGRKALAKEDQYWSAVDEDISGAGSDADSVEGTIQADASAATF
jgi:hypothetical protein